MGYRLFRIVLHAEIDDVGRYFEGVVILPHAESTDQKTMIERELRIVRLMNPEMCLGCAFSKIADVEDERGRHSRMIQCQRLDCDNWDTSDSTAVRSIREADEL